MDAADAALYADFQGDQVEAVEILRDILHMSSLMKRDTEETHHEYAYVGASLEALAMQDTAMIASALPLTNDASQKRRLTPAEIRQFIKEIMDIAAEDGVLADGVNTKTESARFLHRVQSQINLAAMSLACHLFQFDRGRWPASLNDLLPDYLPHAVIDPWGDGRQPLDYVLVKGGLPDGSDRPLVYSRCSEGPDVTGLFFRKDVPAYGAYAIRHIIVRGNVTESTLHFGGQFLDVTRWKPTHEVAEYEEPPVQYLH